MGALPLLLQERLKSVCRDPRVQSLTSVLGRDSELHLVGGTVRDVLRGQEGVDLDFASRLLPEELSRRLEQRGVRVIPTGLRHQTVTAIPVLELPSVEITTFRGPHLSPAGGVSAAQSIAEDLHYRDFTINALAFDVEHEICVDVTGGLNDLQASIVRAVGNPAERFKEDPLRILRMVRFATFPGFSLDETTKNASISFGAFLPKLSVERVRDEMNKLLLLARPGTGLELLRDLGFLGFILPELQACVNFEQNDFHYAELFAHTVEVVEKTRPELRLRLAALLHDIGKPPTLSVDEIGMRHFFRHESVGAEMTEQLMERLRYSGDQVKDVSTLVRTHMRPISAGKSGIRRLIRDTGELYPLWRELKEADASSVHIDRGLLRQEFGLFDAEVEEVKKGPDVSPLKNLALNGLDLIAAGIEPGPRMGKILRALHERVLDSPELNVKDSLLSILCEVLKEVNDVETT